MLFPIVWVFAQRSQSTFFLLIGATTVAVALLGFPTIPVLIRYLPFFLGGVAVSRCKQQFGFRGANVLFVFALILYLLSFLQIAKGIGLPVGNLVPGSEVEAPWFSPLYLALIGTHPLSSEARI